jgi:hypothetical protein
MVLMAGMDFRSRPSASRSPRRSRIIVQQALGRRPSPPR